MHHTSSSVGEKIREIREGLGLGRQAFCNDTSIPKNTLIKIEQGRNDPSYVTIRAILDKWPEYTLWLMQDETNEAAGQINPEIEKARQGSLKAEEKAR